MKNESGSETSFEKRDLRIKKRVIKTPLFRREESWRYKRVNNSWRRPRGIDSKMRMKVKGWPKSVAIGYRSPKKTRGIHPSGYVPVLVSALKDIEKIDPEKQAIMIARTVGGRKRIAMSTRAKERGVHILNPREEEIPEETAESIEGEKEEN